MSSTTWLLLFAIIFLPLIVGYGRCLDHWCMTQIWLWLLLPGVGWFAALAVALRRE